MTIKNLEEAVQLVLDLEARSYPEAASIVSARQELRENIKFRILKKEKIPENSQYYAGVKMTTGRPKYKEIAEALARKFNAEEELESLREKTRIPNPRVYYGRVSDDNYEKRAEQLDIFSSGED